MVSVKRDAQRRRTRAAIIEAAVGRLAAGDRPSMSEIARAADVSRRTVYLYFPTLEQLLADAALEATRADIEPRFVETDDPAARLEAMVRAMQSNVTATEELGRTILRATIGRPADPDGGTAPRRGYRRVGWIESALEPVRERLGSQRFEELVSELMLVVGWEALIVLRDTRGLSPAEAEETSVRMARALLAHALAGT